MSQINRGFLVSFEGIDQCGKSTQVNLLARRLEDAGIEYEVFREPGSTAISEQVRRILLSTEHRKMEPRCELMLYSAARAQLVKEKIIPARENGCAVILDRFYHSTSAYQGYGRGLPLDLIERINLEVAQGYAPVITFVLDISPEVALNRKDEAGRDRLERSSFAFFERVRNGYLEMADKDNRLVVIDGTLPVNEISLIVWKQIKEKFTL